MTDKYNPYGYNNSSSMSNNNNSYNYSYNDMYNNSSYGGSAYSNNSVSIFIYFFLNCSVRSVRSVLNGQNFKKLV